MQYTTESTVNVSITLSDVSTYVADKLIATVYFGSSVKTYSNNLVTTSTPNTGTNHIAINSTTKTITVSTIACADAGVYRVELSAQSESDSDATHTSTRIGICSFVKVTNSTTITM